MCPQNPPAWVLVAGIIIGALLMVGAVRAWGIKGGIIVLIIHVHAGG